MSVPVKEIIETSLVVGKKIVSSKAVKKFAFGKYSDGKTRNLTDAVKGEYLSPKQKKDSKKRKKKKKKNKKFKL